MTENNVIVEMNVTECNGCPFLNISATGEDCNLLISDIQEDKWSNIDYQIEDGWRYEKCPLLHNEYIREYYNIKTKEMCGMDKKRFRIYGNIVEDMFKIIPATIWTIEKYKQKYCNELNKLYWENEQLIKDNFELQGLLGDVRALLRLGKVDDAISRIDKFERGMKK